MKLKNINNITDYSFNIYLSNSSSYISEILYYCLSRLKLKCSIVHSIQLNEPDTVIYIISSEFINKDFPPKYILYHCSLINENISEEKKKSDCMYTPR